MSLLPHWVPVRDGVPYSTSSSFVVRDAVPINVYGGAAWTARTTRSARIPHFATWRSSRVPREAWSSGGLLSWKYWPTRARRRRWELSLHWACGTESRPQCCPKAHLPSSQLWRIHEMPLHDRGASCEDTQTRVPLQPTAVPQAEAGCHWTVSGRTKDRI